MMNKFNRDLLILFKDESSPQTIENEVGILHEVLSFAEKIDNLVAAHEVINVNQCKTYNDRVTIIDTIKHRELKPFVFLNNKN